MIPTPTRPLLLLSVTYGTLAAPATSACSARALQEMPTRIARGYEKIGGSAARLDAEDCFSVEDLLHSIEGEMPLHHAATADARPPAASSVRRGTIKDEVLIVEAPLLERKLVAILAADVEGYSRLMGVTRIWWLAGLPCQLAGHRPTR